jgi:hypothetical protein
LVLIVLTEKSQEEEAAAEVVVRDIVDEDSASDEEGFQEEEKEGGDETNPQESPNTAVEEITSDVNNINMSAVVKQKKFSMDTQFPFIMYDYVSGGRRRVSVDLLVLTVTKDMLRPKMAASGLELQLGTAVPSFFVDAQRLMAANKDDSGFTNDTHKATAFKEAAEKLHAHHESFDDETIIGTPQRIKLPFKCEEVIVDWEVQAFENDSQEVTDGLGGTQFCFVLSIDLVSVTKAREKKPKGGFRVVTSPSRGGGAGADNMVEDDQL